MWVERRFVAFDKTPLFYRFALPAGPLSGIVVAVHGLGEHGGRYRAFGEYLNGLGFGVLLPDLRGYGLSGGPRASLDRFEDYHRDLDATCRWAEREHRSAPLYLFGHSLGGLIAASYAAFFKAPPIRGLVLSSPAFAPAFPVPLWKRVTAAFLSAVAPAYREHDRIDTGRLTHDPDLQAAYLKDPLIDHRISARLYTEFVRMASERRRIAARLSMPVLCLQAGEDAVVSRAHTLKFYDELSAVDKTLTVHEGLYHELLNETGREAILSAIGLWLSSRTRPDTAL